MGEEEGASAFNRRQANRVSRGQVHQIAPTGTGARCTMPCLLQLDCMINSSMCCQSNLQQIASMTRVGGGRCQPTTDTAAAASPAAAAPTTLLGAGPLATHSPT